MASFECFIDYAERMYSVIRQILNYGVVYRFVHADEPLKWVEYLGYMQSHGQKKFSTTVIPFMTVSHLHGSVSRHSLALQGLLEDYRPEPVGYLNILLYSGVDMHDPVSGDLVYPFEFEVRYLETSMDRDYYGNLHPYYYHFMQIADHSEPKFDGLIYVSIDENDKTSYLLRNTMCPFYQRRCASEGMYPPDVVGTYVFMTVLAIDLPENVLAMAIPSYVAQKASYYVVDAEEPDLSGIASQIAIPDEDMEEVLSYAYEMSNEHEAEKRAREEMKYMQLFGLNRDPSYVRRVARVVAGWASELANTTDNCMQMSPAYYGGGVRLKPHRRSRPYRMSRNPFEQRAFELLRPYLGDDIAMKTARAIFRGFHDCDSIYLHIATSLRKAGYREPSQLAWQLARELCCR